MKIIKALGRLTCIYCTRHNNQSEQKVGKYEVGLHVPMESGREKMTACR